MLNLVLSAHATELEHLRSAVRGWAGERGVPDWPLTLVVTELAANAMAVTPADGTVEVSVSADDETIEVCVTDPGPGFGRDVVDFGAIPLPPVNQPRGRGLFLVQQFSTDLRAERRDGRTVVRACQRRTATGSRPADSDPTGGASGKG